MCSKDSSWWRKTEDSSKRFLGEEVFLINVGVIKYFFDGAIERWWRKPMANGLHCRWRTITGDSACWMDFETSNFHKRMWVKSWEKEIEKGNQVCLTSCRFQTLQHFRKETLILKQIFRTLSWIILDDSSRNFFTWTFHFDLLRISIQTFRSDLLTQQIPFNQRSKFYQNFG